MNKPSNKLILIIDDSQDNLDLLKLLLESKGYLVNCATNGLEALVLLNQLTRLPDIILLDMQMPGMGGYDFLTIKKTLDHLKNIPVLIMTGEENINVQIEQSNPCGILLKPLDIKTLVNEISKYIEL